MEKFQIRPITNFIRNAEMHRKNKNDTLPNSLGTSSFLGFKGLGVFKGGSVIAEMTLLSR